ncbi:MAG: DUF3102 domain-containing protein [Magnetococcales bacterium]|nr:DUF3102 domain-containing protein [Magnetococcales bacterium]
MSETSIVKYSETVQAATERIKLRMKRSAEDIIEIGRDLTLVKEQLDHGEFTHWLQTEFDMAVRTAQRFISVSAKFGQKRHNVVFRPTVLYELAASTTPQSVIDYAEEKADAGKTVSVKEIKELKRKLKEAKQAKREFEKKTLREQDITVQKIKRLNDDIRTLQDRERQWDDRLHRWEQEAIEKTKKAEAIIAQGPVTVEVEKLVEKPMIPEGYSSIAEAIADKQRELRETEEKLKAVQEQKQNVDTEVAQIESAEKERRERIKQSERILNDTIDRTKQFLKDIQEAKIVVASIAYHGPAYIHEISTLRDLLREAADILDYWTVSSSNGQVINGEVVQMPSRTPN